MIIKSSSFLYFFCYFFLLFGCSSQSQNNSKNPFKTLGIDTILTPSDCNEFKYKLSDKYFVNSKGEPFLTKEDSIKIINYAIKFNQFKYAILGRDTNIYRLFYLLPRIRNIIDTLWYDSLITYKDKIKYRNLDHTTLYSVISSDAVIKGEVTDKIYVRDSANCYYYKTEYKVKVYEVLHSYFSLQKNDVVLLKTYTGYEAGCMPKMPNLFHTTSHKEPFKIGDKCIFLLAHDEYYCKFITFINNPMAEPDYSDEYCSSAFQLSNFKDTYDCEDKKLVENIRLFFKTKFKTKPYE